VSVYEADVDGLTSVGVSEAVNAFGAAPAAAARTSTQAPATSNGIRRRLSKKDPFL
jgi:hypothetical protein